MATYSTLATAKAAYLANTDYADGAGDAAKARAFRSACRALLVLLPAQAAHGGSSTTMSVQSVEAELARAERWIAAHDADAASAGRVIYADVGSFRE